MHQRQDAVAEILIGVLEAVSNRHRTDFEAYQVERWAATDMLHVYGVTGEHGLRFDFHVDIRGAVVSWDLDTSVNTRLGFLFTAIERAFRSIADGY